MELVYLISNICFILLLRKRLKLASLFVVAETIILTALLLIASDSLFLTQIINAILGEYTEPLKTALTAGMDFSGIEVSTLALIQILFTIIFVYVTVIGMMKAVQYILKKEPSPEKVEQHDKIINRKYSLRNGSQKIFLVTCRLRN